MRKRLVKDMEVVANFLGKKRAVLTVSESSYGGGTDCLTEDASASCAGFVSRPIRGVGALASMYE